MRQFEAQVTAGIEFLDSKAPKDWRTKIIPEKLDMDAPTHCILGQIFGDYYNAIIEWNNSMFDSKFTEKMTVMGFILTYDETYPQCDKLNLRNKLNANLIELKTEWLLQLSQ